MKTKAIILKKQDTNEYDQLVTCYTEEAGKITAIAKSILKKNSIQAMHLDLFNLVDFELVNGNHMPIITGAQAENAYANLKSSIMALPVAYVFAEYVEKITFEYLQDQDLWNFLVSTLDVLNSNPSDYLSLLRKGQRRILSILGHEPNLEECAICADRNGKECNVFDVARGGLVCRSCFLQGSSRGILVKKEDLDLLRGMAGGFNGSRSILDTIFEQVADKKLNSLSFFYQTNSMPGHSAK